VTNTSGVVGMDKGRCAVPSNSTSFDRWTRTEQTGGGSFSRTNKGHSKGDGSRGLPVRSFTGMRRVPVRGKTS